MLTYPTAFSTHAAPGPKALYGGALGKRIVDHLKANGGFLTIHDLAVQKAEWAEPISATFRGHTVWELPPFISKRRALLDPNKAAERVDPGEAITASETIYHPGVRQPAECGGRGALARVRGDGRGDPTGYASGSKLRWQTPRAPG